MVSPTGFTSSGFPPQGSRALSRGYCFPFLLISHLILSMTHFDSLSLLALLWLFMTHSLIMAPHDSCWLPLPHFSNMFPPEITVYKAGSLVTFPSIHFSTYLDVLLGTALYYFFILQSTYLDVLLVWLCGTTPSSNISSACVVPLSTVWVYLGLPRLRSS